MMSLHAAEIQNDMLPSLPPQLYIYCNDSEAQMQSLEFALTNGKVNPLGSDYLCDYDSRLILNEVGVGIAEYVIPHTTNGYNYQAESSSSSTAERVGYPYSVVENCFMESQICDSGLPEFSLPNSQNLVVSPPAIDLRNVKRKQQMEQYSSKSAVANNDTISRIKRRTNTNNGTRNNNQPHILETECDYSKVPAVRRSQKLGDKITILQKLVSPYGKTDTASVLQEAEIYIKQLHTKIANMYELLSSSHVNAATLSQLDALGGMRTIPLDLRQRGLCVMPVAITRDLTRNNGTMDRGCLAARTGNNFPTNIIRY
uniref:BHLH domain-containing protein n=1 Tax=Kalanchoe fedtschenkoi TaxID=63787 RepID=A0A7N0V5L5_KALFE